ncbi:MAG: ArsR/SmtB family transcription factor [Psychrobacter sp.]
MEENSKYQLQLSRSTPLFIALSDPIRQDIFNLLVHSGPLNVMEITVQTDLARPTISHHLKLLLEAGTLSVEKRGVKRFYSAEPQAVANQLQGLARAFDNRE